MSLLLPGFLLLGLGAVIVYTSSNYLAQVQGMGQFSYLTRHMARLLLGIVVMIGVWAVPTDFWRRHRFWVLGFGLGLLLITLVLGKTVYGAKRWLSLPGITLQASDPARIALVLFLADHLARRRHHLRAWRDFLAVLGIVFAFVGLTLLEPDLSTSALMGLLGFLMMFVAGVKPGRLALVLALLGGLGFAAVRSFPHAQRRWESFTKGESYQVTQAHIGLAEGGLLGVGPGRGKEKFLYLPKPHTDFIFAVVGEEFGLVGSLGVLLLLGIVVLRAMVLAREVWDPYKALLAFGMGAMLGLYGLFHASVVLGLLPPTGLPFPFLSYGGSSTLANMAALGFLLAVAREEKP